MAEVIPFANAMNRAAARSRAQRRESARVAADGRAREGWLEDLASWPRRFRAVIEPELRDPKCDLAAIAAARAGEQQWSSWIGARTPADEIAQRLQNYRGHIRYVREARSKGWRTRNRRTMRHQADRLIEALWLYGFRKVNAAMRGIHRAPEASA